jgi:hypothetical protein
MTKIQNKVNVLSIRILNFGIVSNFEFRVSDLKAPSGSLNKDAFVFSFIYNYDLLDRYDRSIGDHFEFVGC